MKKLYSTVLIMTLIITAAIGQKTLWKPDPLHSRITFEVTHMTISEVMGQFHDFEGTVYANKDDFTDIEINITIDASTLDTDNEKRDNHLKSEDFIYVEKYPTITFKSNSMQKSGENTYKLTGDLTIRGVTKSETFNVEHKGTVTDTEGNKRAGFQIIGTINRFDYNIDWNNTFTGGVIVGKEVDIMCNVQLVRTSEATGSSE